MNFYHKKENVEQYRAMMDGYDNSFVINQLKKFLPPSSTILELGMGTGADLLELSRYYTVTGTDFSPIFISEFRAVNPEIEVYELNAADFYLNQTFDCIYSNKVLYHLSANDFEKSLQAQFKHLNKNGIIFMTMWYGEHKEEIYEDDLYFTYYTEEDLIKRVPKYFKIEKMVRYTEIEQDDSLLIVLRKQ